METIKQTNIKNRTYYFYNDFIDIETFDSNMLNQTKKSYKNLDIYNIRYVTIKKNGYGYDINNVNSLYLRINNVNGYIEEINEEKYLVCDDTHENKKLLERYDDVFSGIVGKIRKMNDDCLEYAKDYMKIKFNSDNNLSLNKQLKFYNMNVTIRCVFSEDNKLYPQVFLDEALYSLQTLLKYDRIDISEGIDVDKTNKSKECKLCHYWYFLNKNFSYGPNLYDGCY